MSEHFRLIGSETVALTKDLAAEFASMSALTSERELKPKRIAYLKDAVLNGKAVSFHWARAKVAETGVLHRVNGQHSSTMLASLDGQFPDGLKAHIDTFEVDDNQSLALLHQQFDNRASTRAVSDVSGICQGFQPSLAKVSKAAGRAALEGAIWWKRKIVGDYIPGGDGRFNLFFDPELHPFMQMVGRIYTAKTPEFTTPVLGAMFGTWDREPTVAEAFWAEVAQQGAGNDATHPTVVLDAWLLEARERKDADKPKEHEVHRACALAWNAYRNHRTLTKIGKYDAIKGAPELD